MTEELSAARTLELIELLAEKLSELTRPALPDNTKTSSSSGGEVFESGMGEERLFADPSEVNNEETSAKRQAGIPMTINAKKLVRASKTIIWRRLGAVLKTETGVANYVADVLPTVSVMILERATGDPQFIEKLLADDAVYLEKYFLKTLSNLAVDQLHTWSSVKANPSKDQQGVIVDAESNGDLADAPPEQVKKMQGEQETQESKKKLHLWALTRVELDNDVNDTPGEVAALGQGGGADILAADLERVDSILVGRGLSAAEIGYIKRYLAGESFVDMAKKDGGSSDKYRKIYKRATEKAGLAEFL